jgi:hypothetical protein
VEATAAVAAAAAAAIVAAEAAEALPPNATAVAKSDTSPVLALRPQEAILGASVEEVVAAEIMGALVGRAGRLRLGLWSRLGLGVGVGLTGRCKAIPAAA